jgi:hypothetical protein
MFRVRIGSIAAIINKHRSKCSGIYQENDSHRNLAIFRVKYIDVNDCLTLLKDLIDEDKHDTLKNVKTIATELSNSAVDGEHAFLKITDNNTPFIVLLLSNSDDSRLSMKLVFCNDNVFDDKIHDVIKHRYGIINILPL